MVTGRSACKSEVRSEQKHELQAQEVESQIAESWLSSTSHVRQEGLLSCLVCKF